MARMNEFDKKHQRNIVAYELQVDKIFQSAAREAALIAASLGDFKPDRPFSFADYPITRKRVEKLLSGLKKDLSAVIVNGVNTEWTLANNKNSELANQVFGDNVGKLSEEQYRRYYSTNDNARKAFLERKEAGLNLSDRVWRYTDQFKSEIEMGLDIGLRDGLSADELSRDLRKYLRYPDKLFRRVRDEHGNLVLSQAAKAFHPGQGVYRSSYKNARRLAATETNMAYRTADYERWQQLDFVVGIEIRLSNNHTLNGVPFEDICDDLKGRYPKDFKFTGWHPHCRCHAVAILKTEEEMAEDNERILQGGEPSKDSVNQVLDPIVPNELSMEQFNKIASSMNVSSKERNILYNAQDLYIDSSWSRVINSELAKGKIGKNVPKDFMGDIGSLQQVETLDTVIGRNKLPKDLLVYRKVSEHWLNREGYDFSVGKIVNEYGFTSTSAVKDANVMRKSKSVRLEIIARKGANAYVTENVDESEIIFPRNSKFKVLSISNREDGKIVKLELLSNSGQSSDGLDKLNYWISENKERAKGWSSMPYFIRQNPQYIQGFEVDTYTKAERKFTRAKRTNEAMQESLGIFLQSKYPALPNTEKAAIFHYTQGEGATFRQLNNQLRRGNLTEFNEAFSDLLSKGLSKLETTTEPVYRTMRLNRTDFNSFVQLASNKASKTFKGFTSSSLDKKTTMDFAENKREPKKNETDILLVIRGKSGHPIEGLSQFGGRFTGRPNQREVLFDKGCKFRFDEVKKEDGIYVFYLTEI